ncbi:GNAT family N-acetyltransferase [Aliidongia dinghuensis]|uniref:GNAT family N-acetyltransferase n=1 Tax=Aliidongia dinghuensis TaxID=1867774 RepID=A0A8J2YSB9_9PROT|nr:GNAT family N-acetyltransferase [Aliidongia dinghuensis]GGF08361.1 GNAT family N-acetyltransferase [Aliidongia dinghuensis]
MILSAAPERFVWRAFDALGTAELYALLQLRSDVFVVEQNCVFADIDGKDAAALHLLVWVGDMLGGYLRVFAPADAAKIGRVVVAPAWRSTGLGRRLMAAALDQIAARWGAVPVELSAQAHLERFYSSFGFERTGPDYLEDGILHCDMRRAVTAR